MARPTKQQQKNKKISEALSKMTPEALQRLKDAFAIDATVVQACDHAGISERTYYYWVKKNPELLQEFEVYRQKLPFKAKYNIAQQIHAGNISLSQWLLSRKEPEAYSERVKIEHSGQIEQGSATYKEDDDIRRELKEKLRANIQKRWAEKEKLKESQKNENPK